MSDNLDHHLDVYHYGDEPTPPQPPEMPKPDATCVHQDGRLSCSWFRDFDTGTTSIERAYSELSRVAQQQRERAEKAEEELVYKQDHIDEEVAINDHLQAENARLREALAHLRLWGDADVSDYAHQALHRTPEASDQRSPTPEATPHEEAGETTDE